MEQKSMTECGTVVCVCVCVCVVVCVCGGLTYSLHLGCVCGQSGGEGPHAVLVVVKPAHVLQGAAESQTSAGVT